MATELPPCLVLLGGSCFMGRTLVERITSGGAARVDVVLCNRGTIYWASPIPTSAPGVRHILLDRDEPATVDACCAPLGALNRPLVLVDFSCDDEPQMRWFLDCASRRIPAGRLRGFVHISSDSVYCDDAAARTSVDGLGSSLSSSEIGLVSENAPCLGADDADGYGRDKRMIELLLLERLPHAAVLLRLPDVLGPYDDTGRYWATVLWATVAHVVPLRFPRGLCGRPVSVVFSADVVEVLLHLFAVFASGDEHAARLVCGPFNLACAPPIALDEFVRKIVRSATATTADLQLVGPSSTSGKSSTSSGSSSSSSASSSRSDATSNSNSSDGSSDASSSSDDETASGPGATCDFYPSVDCGPLSVWRAEARLLWCPTPVDDVIRLTSAFFAAADAPLKYPREFERTMRKLPGAVRAAVRQRFRSDAKASD